MFPLCCNKSRMGKVLETLMSQEKLGQWIVTEFNSNP